MYSLKKLVASCVITVAMAGSALAGGVVPIVQNVDALAVDGAATTKAFVGLNWAFGASPAPELVLGVAQSQTMADGTLAGGKVAAFVNVVGGVSLDKVKLTGLYGTRNTQGELGFGYNFQRGNVFGVAGANAGNFVAGVDVYGGLTLEPYVGVHSIGLFGDFGGYTCVGVDAPSADPSWVLDGLVNDDQCRFERPDID